MIKFETVTEMTQLWQSRQTTEDGAEITNKGQRCVIYLVMLSESVSPRKIGGHAAEQTPRITGHTSTR